MRWKWKTKKNILKNYGNIKVNEFYSNFIACDSNFTRNFLSTCNYAPMMTLPLGLKRESEKSFG